MLEILVRPLAEGDVKNIWRYRFEKWGERQADSHIDDMQKAMKNIAQNLVSSSFSPQKGCIHSVTEKTTAPFSAAANNSTS